MSAGSTAILGEHGRRIRTNGHGSCTAVRDIGKTDSSSGSVPGFPFVNRAGHAGRCYFPPLAFGCEVGRVRSKIAPAAARRNSPHVHNPRMFGTERETHNSGAAAAESHLLYGQSLVRGTEIVCTMPTL